MAALGFRQQYKHCYQHGITEDDLFAGRLTSLTQITNGLILDLIKFRKTKRLSWKLMGIWLSSILGVQVELTYSIQQVLRKLRETERALSKNKKKEKLNELHTIPFQLPGIPTLAGVAPASEEPVAELAQSLHKKTEKLQKSQSAVKNLKRQVKRREDKLQRFAETVQSKEKELQKVTGSFSSAKSALTALEQRVVSLGQQKVS